MVRWAFVDADDVHFEQPRAAVKDARRLLATQDESPFVRPAAIPLSLRIPGLRFARLHRDHVDLVLARNPDWLVGARIWSVQHRPHRDTPTRYPEIYFFRYTNDASETPGNIP